jgi:hypothetical protein
MPQEPSIRASCGTWRLRASSLVTSYPLEIARWRNCESSVSLRRQRASSGHSSLGPLIEAVCELTEGRFRYRFRPGQRRLRREPCTPGRQRDRFHHSGADVGRKVAGAAQGDRAAYRPGRVSIQPDNGAVCQAYLSPFKAAARSFAVEAVAAPVLDRSALESVVAAQAREPNGGLIAMPDTFMFAHHAQVASLAAHYRLPAITPWRLYAELGGLLSYGIDLPDNFRRAATYADRILKGAKPSDLPVQAPVKFELVINMKTAKALGHAGTCAAARSRPAS